jgi:hypothetical protein
MKIRTYIFILLTLAVLMGLSAIVLAQSSDPQTLFTHNVTATGTSVAVTEMDTTQESSGRSLEPFPRTGWNRPLSEPKRVDVKRQSPAE